MKKNLSWFFICCYALTAKDIKTDGTITNSDDLQITSSSQTLKATSPSQKLINYGNLNISGASLTGIEISNGASGENRGILTVKAEKFSSAIKAMGENSNAKNLGSIFHYGDSKNTSNAILAQGGAKANNSGKIEVYGKNVSAMNASNKQENTLSKIINSPKGVIYLFDSSNGLKVDKFGEGDNQGKILIRSSGSIGMLSSADATSTSYALNNGLISVSGNSSSGMQANNFGKVENKKTIEVYAQKYTSGLKAVGEKAVANNIGSLFHYGDGTNTSNATLAQNGGEIKNEGIIKVYGKNTSAMSAGENATLKNLKEIRAYDSAMGMKMESQSLGENSGSIFTQSSTAIWLNNGFFINSGRIDNSYGVLIKSNIATNNAILLKSNTLQGKILGNSGVDLLYLDSTISNLNIQQYQALIVHGNRTIKNSFVSFSHHDNTQNLITQADQKFFPYLRSRATNSLTLQNSILSLDLGVSSNQTFSFLKTYSMDVENGSLISLSSQDGTIEFNLTQILGLQTSNLKINTQSIIWKYYINSKNEWIASKRSYDQALTDKKLSAFSSLLQSQKGLNVDLNYAALVAESLQTQSAFTEAMAELSGSLHGYMLDIASMSANSFATTMMQEAQKDDFTRLPEHGKTTHKLYAFLNSSTLFGNLKGAYGEAGAYAMIENIPSANAKVGVAFGGSLGEAKFNQDKSGKALTQNFYVGAYYNHDFLDCISLSANARVTGSYINTQRNILYGNISESFSAQYPIYGFGAGFMARYNYTYDFFRFGVFTGLDYTKLVQGNLYEDQRPNTNVSGMAVNPTGSVDEQGYNSLFFKVGTSIENIGYLFSKKYTIGIRIQYQGEVGDIKTKYLKLQGLAQKYSFQTLDLTHMLGYGIYANYNFTPYLKLSSDLQGGYTKDYNAFLFSLGLSYKFDSLEAMLNANKENNNTRWKGSVSFVLETEDNSDRVYFNIFGEKTSGDYVTSTRYTPKLILNLTDTQTNLGFYYESFYSDNQMFQGLQKNEAKQFSTREHLEMRWSQNIDFFTQSYSLGYRNEYGKKPLNFGKKNFEMAEFGGNQIRFSPSYAFNLGKGFTLWGSLLGIWNHSFAGYDVGDSDFFLEEYLGLNYAYSKLFLSLSWFRGDKWFGPKSITDRYVINQLRPTMRFYFGNGANIELAMRIPMLNGEYYRQANSQKILAQNYETRYTIKYTQPLFLGLVGSISASLLDIKVKALSTNTKYNFHSFRTTMGLTYNFGF